MFEFLLAPSTLPACLMPHACGVLSLPPLLIKAFLLLVQACAANRQCGCCFALWCALCNLCIWRSNNRSCTCAHVRQRARTACIALVCKCTWPCHRLTTVPHTLAAVQVPFKDVFQMANPFGLAADGMTPLPLDANGYVTSIPSNVTHSPKVHA